MDVFSGSHSRVLGRAGQGTRLLEELDDLSPLPLLSIESIGDTRIDKTIFATLSHFLKNEGGPGEAAAIPILLGVGMGIGIDLMFSSKRTVYRRELTLEGLQGSFRFGDTVRVVDTNGIATKGKVEGVSPTGLMLGVGRATREFAQAQIRQIQVRRPDPWWNGALIGGSAGGLLMGTTLGCRRNDYYCPSGDTFIVAAVGAGIGAAVGAAIDLSIRRFDTILPLTTTSSRVGVRVVPLVTRNKKGAQITFSFD